MKLVLSKLFGEPLQEPEYRPTDRYAFVTASHRVIETAEYEEVNEYEDPQWRFGVLEQDCPDYDTEGIEAEELMSEMCLPCEI